MGRYADVYRWSLDAPEEFWARVAEKISWSKKWDRVLDDRRPPFYRWFAGAELNTCWNALDRHVENGGGGVPALIWDSPVTATVRTFTYRELRDRVAVFAGALRGLGIGKGDTVILYMPMIPEAVVGMLACARLGAIHSVVFGGFAPNELAIRIDHARPKVILTASGAIEGSKVLEYRPLVEKAIELARHKPKNCVVYRRPEIPAELTPGRDLDWEELAAAAGPAECVAVQATDPLYILYTSGTTGMPKGVVRDNGGHAVALAWSMENIFDVRAGDVFWAASDLGWVVGHSYILYGPLLAGCTSVLYEGKPVGTPDAGAFWRVASQHRVRTLFTSPTAIRAIKKEDPGGERVKGRDLYDFKYLFLAGERLDPDTFHWASRILRRPVIDHWWQTETGWPIAANCMGLEPLPIKPGSPTVPVPGYDVRILDPQGRERGPREEGAVVLKLPLPPGCLPTLWDADERYVESYTREYPGYYLTADGGYKDEDGYLFIMGRTDDVINVAGHRLSTGEMEEVIATHPDVAECAVIGAADPLKGQVPVGLVVLKSGVRRSGDEVRADLARLVREKIGPIACYKDTVVVEKLPKTRSGKILRKSMRSMAEGKEFRVPSTIEDPSVLASIGDALATLGYPKPA
jgi:propionyl-CoA synthetase